MHHVPRIVEVRNKSLAFSVENVLIVVDVSRFCGNLQPFMDRMNLTHAIQIHNQHAGLEISVAITHMQLLVHIFGANTILHIEIADEIDIWYCGDSVIAHFCIKQFGNHTVHYKIATKYNNFE